MIAYEEKTIESICIKELEKSLKKESGGKIPMVTRRNLARRTIREASENGLDISFNLRDKAKEIVQDYFAEAV